VAGRRPLQPWPRERIKLARWRAVCKARCLWQGLFDEFQQASDWLKGTPAEAGCEMMTKDFYTVENSLPRDQRQPRIKANRSLPRNRHNKEPTRESMNELHWLLDWCRQHAHEAPAHWYAWADDDEPRHDDDDDC
jgi:hypothetical protein